MIKNMRGDDQAIGAIHTTTKSAKSKLNNTAMRRNLADLSAVLPNDTCWSGNFNMVNWFVQIWPEIIAVSNEENCDLPIEAAHLFAGKALKYGNMLSKFTDVMKALQKRSMTLHAFRVDLNDRFNLIALSADKQKMPLYHCKLGEPYNGVKSRHVANSLFESAVLKLQENCPQNLTVDEKEAVKCLTI